MFFKTRDDLFLFLEHGKYEKYLSEFMEQQKQIKAPSKRRGLCVWSVADLRCLPAGQRLGNDLREVVYGQCPAAGNGFFTKRAGRYDRTGSGGGEHVGNALDHSIGSHAVRPEAALEECADFTLNVDQRQRDHGITQQEANPYQHTLNDHGRRRGHPAPQQRVDPLSHD